MKSQKKKYNEYFYIFYKAIYIIKKVIYLNKLETISHKKLEDNNNIQEEQPTLKENGYISPDVLNIFNQLSDLVDSNQLSKRRKNDVYLSYECLINCFLFFNSKTINYLKYLTV